MENDTAISQLSTPVNDSLIGFLEALPIRIKSFYQPDRSNLLALIDSKCESETFPIESKGSDLFLKAEKAAMEKYYSGLAELKNKFTSKSLQKTSQWHSLITEFNQLKEKSATNTMELLYTLIHPLNQLLASIDFFVSQRMKWVNGIIELIKTLIELLQFCHLSGLLPQLEFREEQNRVR